MVVKKEIFEEVTIVQPRPGKTTGLKDKELEGLGSEGCGGTDGGQSSCEETEEAGAWQEMANG